MRLHRPVSWQKRHPLGDETKTITEKIPKCLKEDSRGKKFQFERRRKP